MPIDDYLGKLEGINNINKIQNIPFRQKNKPLLSSHNYILLKGKTYRYYSYPDILIDLSYINAPEWEYAHQEADELDSFMINPRQFIDYLKLLISGVASDQNNTPLNPSFLIGKFNEIINTDKLIWLDAEFTTINGIRFIEFDHKITPNGIRAQEKHLFDEDNLLRNNSKISIEDFLNSKNSFGLPDFINSNDGELVKYFFPRFNNNVAFYGGAVINERIYGFNSEKYVFRPGIVGDPLTDPVTIVARKA